MFGKAPLIVNIVICCHQACWKLVLCWTPHIFATENESSHLCGETFIALMPLIVWVVLKRVAMTPIGMPKTETWNGETSSFWYQFWERISISHWTLATCAKKFWLQNTHCHCPTLFFTTCASLANMIDIKKHKNARHKVRKKEDILSGWTLSCHSAKHSCHKFASCLKNYPGWIVLQTDPHGSGIIGIYPTML